jgi:hypothetical protein
MFVHHLVDRPWARLGARLQQYASVVVAHAVTSHVYSQAGDLAGVRHGKSRGRHTRRGCAFRVYQAREKTAPAALLSFLFLFYFRLTWKLDFLGQKC